MARLAALLRHSRAPDRLAAPRLPRTPRPVHLAVSPARPTGSGLAAPFRTRLRTNLLFRGPSPYYPVGTIDVRRAGEVVFGVDAVVTQPGRVRPGVPVDIVGRS